MTTETPVLDKTIVLNGLRFHYRDWPNDGARSLVLLHGFIPRGGEGLAPLERAMVKRSS